MNNYTYIYDIFLSCSLILLNTIFIPNVSIYILKLKERKYTASLLYIFIHAAVVTLLLGFNANLARVYVYSVTILNILVSIFLYYKSNEFFFKYYFIINLIYIKLSVISIIIICIYTFYSTKINFLFNGHDPYLFGIPFETLTANYSSRLKVFDNYPFVWTKFHFFNGAVSSLILAPTLIKNVFIYKFSKLIILILSILSISEFVKLSKNQIILFLILSVFFSGQFAWMYYTNGFLSLYLFVLILILIYKNENLLILENQFILMLALLLFSLSTVRNLVPGVCVLLFIIYRNYVSLKKLELLKVFILSIIVISILSMVFFGNSYINNSTVQLNYKNFFSVSWNNLFLIRNVFLNLNWFITSYKISIFVKFIWVSALFFLILLNRFVLISYIKENFFTKKIIFVSYIFINGLSIYFYSNKYLYSLSFLSIFLFPILLLNIKYEFQKNIKNVLLVFFIFSIFQILVIDPGSSIPNAILLDYIIFTYLFLQFKFVNVKWISLTLILIVIVPFFYFQNMIIPVLSDRTTHDINLDKSKNQKLNDLQYDFIIRTAINGNNYYHNKLIGDSISISQNFISKNKY